jgi:hypothetical protein
VQTHAFLDAGSLEDAGLCEVQTAAVRQPGREGQGAGGGRAGWRLGGQRQSKGARPRRSRGFPAGGASPRGAVHLGLVGGTYPPAGLVQDLAPPAFGSSTGRLTRGRGRGAMLTAVPVAGQPALEALAGHAARRRAVVGFPSRERRGRRRRARIPAKSVRGLREVAAVAPAIG